MVMEPGTMQIRMMTTMVADTEDAFPLAYSETSDNDGDGIGDNADTDDDGDGVADTEDAAPLDGSETSDNDGDGIGVTPIRTMTTMV